MDSREWDKKLKQAEDSAAAAKASADARKRREQEPSPAQAKMHKYLDKYWRCEISILILSMVMLEERQH